MNDRLEETQGERGLYTAGVHGASHWHPDGEPRTGYTRTYAQAHGTVAHSPRHGLWWWSLVVGQRALAGGHVATREQAQTECDAAAERHGVS